MAPESFKNCVGGKNDIILIVKALHLSASRFNCVYSVQKVSAGKTDHCPDIFTLFTRPFPLKI